MSTDSQPARRLLTRASEERCKHCPPDRVCAWDCVQGAGITDIVIGAMLEQSDSWALRQAPADQGAVEQALWELFNG